MNKQQIIDQYNRLEHADKCAVTGAALDYLAENEINVGRSTLNHWRKTDHASPLATWYLRAYQHAFQTLSAAMTT